ncbi:MAG: ion transporter [Pseudomonadota bacterium]|jgi:Ion transport protein.
MTMQIAADRPAGPRQRIADFIESPRIQRLIITLILLNALLLGLETFPSVMARAGAWLDHADQVLLTVFVLELLLKLVGQGWRFFRNGWNVFDAIVVGIALLPSSGAFSVLRALRVLRVLRLVSAVPRMRFVVESLVRSLPGLGSIGCLLLLFFYVYAVMATKLYGERFPEWFGDLWSSMFSLFQIMTLEGWAEIAREVMAVSPWAWLFFLVFILIGTFTVLNLFIAVIVNAMQEPHTPVEHKAVASADDVAALREEIAALRRTLERDGRT